MGKEQFLILNLAIAFYNVGTIWAIEVDIFRSWQYLDVPTFRIVQQIHWKKLPYWVFIPVGLSFSGAIALLWYHPAQIPGTEIWLAFLLQLVSHVLTALHWGRLQARLAKDNKGGASIYLQKIIKTHWLRTTLITCYALVLFYMSLQLF